MPSNKLRNYNSPESHNWSNMSHTVKASSKTSFREQQQELRNCTINNIQFKSQTQHQLKCSLNTSAYMPLGCNSQYFCIGMNIYDDRVRV